MSRKKRRRDSDLFRPVDSFGQLLCDVLRRRVGIEYFSWIDRKIEGLMYIWAMKSFNLRPLGRFFIAYDTDRFHGISNIKYMFSTHLVFLCSREILQVPVRNARNSMWEM